jgi:hypothetical protein
MPLQQGYKRSQSIFIAKLQRLSPKQPSLDQASTFALPLSLQKRTDGREATESSSDKTVKKKY